MARIRSVKPELRTDLIVASWPREVRYAWVLLWGYCDDQGRGVDDLRLLTSDLFPLDRDVTERKFARWLKLFTDSGRICHYEADGHRFFHVINWHHQRINRPTPSRLPPCPTHGGPDERSLIRSRSASLNGSRNDSVSDSPPTRAPAEQGAGSRERSREQGAVVAHATNPSDDDTATKLLDQHTAAIARPMPPASIASLRTVIGQALTDTHDDVELVTAGLTRLRERGGKPGLLPHLIGDIQTERAAGTDPADLLNDPEIAAWLAKQEATP